MPIVLDRPNHAERLTDADWQPANATTTLPVWATLSAQTPGLREIRVPSSGNEFVVRIEFAPPQWLLPTLRDFETLLELRAGWDAHDAPPIQPAYVESALQVIFAVMKNNAPAPTVVPTSRGGVQIEWHTRGIDLEIEFETPSRIRGFFEDHRTGESWEQDVSIDQSRLVRAVALLARRT